MVSARFMAEEEGKKEESTIKRKVGD